MLALLLLLAGPASAQVVDPALGTEVRHLSILGAWSASNLAGGATGLALADDPQWRSFHGMNLGWNAVNGAIAVAGGVGLAHRRGRFDSDEDLVLHHRRLQRSLTINLVLDTLYIATGATLWAIGGQSGTLDRRGAGQALVVQGAFLTVFDAAFLRSHRTRTAGARGRRSINAP